MSLAAAAQRVQTSEARVWSELRPLLKPHRTILVVACLLSAVAAATEVLIIAFVAAFTGRLLTSSESVPLLSSLSDRALVLATAFAIVFKIALDLLLAKVNARAQRRFEAHVRREAAVLQSRARWDIIEDSEPGALHSLMWNSVTQARSAFSQVLSLASNISSLLLMLIAAVYSAGALALAGVFGLALFAIIFRPLGRAAKRAGARFKSATLTYGAGLNEDIRMSREIRVLGAQDVVAERLSASGEALAKAAADQTYLSAVLSSGYANAVYAVALLGFIAINASGTANPAPLAALVLLLYRSLVYGRSVQSSLQSLSSSAPFVADVNEWLDRLRRNSESVVGASIATSFEELRFIDAGLTYANGTVGLDAVNLSIVAGEAIAVVGPSGSGKSSFVSLILALREATRGQITINGTSMRELDKSSWRNHISLVPQESLLFDASIEENVRCWRDGIDDARIVESLRQANVLDEVLAMPQGVRSQVGEGGRRLSGGQRQRICLARALAGAPEVLVLDEPTSALDAASERAVRESLERLKGHMALLIVAHRMTTVAMCDRVLVFEHGNLSHDTDPETALEDSEFFSLASDIAGSG